MVINSTAVQYNLTSNQQQWLNNNTAIYLVLTKTIYEDPDLTYSYYDAVDFLNRSITHIMNDPSITASQFQNPTNNGALATFTSPNNNLPVTVADVTHEFGQPLDIRDPNAQYYSYQDANTLINSFDDPGTDDPIEFYLIAKYKGSALLDLSMYSTNGLNYHVGDYYLTPNFDNNGTLLFWSAWRNKDLGVEYLIQPSAVAQFIQHYTYYKVAANLFYMGGVPAPATIKVVAGDRLAGLKEMWGQALTDPVYLTNLAVAFAVGATPPEKVQFIDYVNDTATSKSIPNYTISMTLDDFKSNLSTNTSSSWQPTSTPGVEVLTKGNFSYTARTTLNSNNGPTVDVYYKGVLQVKYRLQ